MNSLTVPVSLGTRSYDIVIAATGVEGLSRFPDGRSRGESAFIVGDEHVAPHAHRVQDVLGTAGLRTAIAILPAGEKQKSLESACRLYDQLLEFPADRKTLIVAVGGGVVGDLAGFVAATYARGLPFLIVPTSLLAMVDSSVGGKVAINYGRRKNLIGAFHQPVGVLIDLNMLATLPDREYRSGLAEVVKYGMSLDAELFAFLEDRSEDILQREANALLHIVSRSCRLKAAIVERDEREETGARALLNFGHTFAHAFESASTYEGWLHGEAVAAGMVCASMLACRRGSISPAVLERLERLLTRFGLPVRPAAWSVPELLAFMRSDKKNLEGRFRLVLPHGLSTATLVEDVAEAEIVQVLEELVADPAGP